MTFLEFWDETESENMIQKMHFKQFFTPIFTFLPFCVVKCQNTYLNRVLRLKLPKKHVSDGIHTVFYKFDLL